MRIWILALSTISLLACTSKPAATRTSDAKPVQAKAGQALAKDKCGGCHSIGTTGQSPLKEAPPFRELSARHVGGNLSEVVVEGIATGHPSMPKWILTPDEAKALVAYMQSVQVK